MKGRYVDGFILAVPKSNLDTYREQAQLAGEVWIEHGALSYVETVADDVSSGELTSFPRAVMAQDDELVIFAWATYASRADRDAVFSKVMEDPRMKAQMETMVFDGKRLIYGGFETLVELGQ